MRITGHFVKYFCILIYYKKTQHYTYAASWALLFVPTGMRRTTTEEFFGIIVISSLYANRRENKINIKLDTSVPELQLRSLEHCGGLPFKDGSFRYYLQHKKQFSNFTIGHRTGNSKLARPEHDFASFKRVVPAEKDLETSKQRPLAIFLTNTLQSLSSWVFLSYIVDQQLWL